MGTADPDEIDEALESGGLAEVYHDGQLVGHFGADGFVPIDETEP